jgi:hypothetical protein
MVLALPCAAQPAPAAMAETPPAREHEAPAAIAVFFMPAQWSMEAVVADAPFMPAQWSMEAVVADAPFAQAAFISGVQLAAISAVQAPPFMAAAVVAEAPFMAQHAGACLLEAEAAAVVFVALVLLPHAIAMDAATTAVSANTTA